jgi:hypothetical protein
MPVGIDSQRAASFGRRVFTIISATISILEAILLALMTIYNVLHPSYDYPVVSPTAPPSVDNHTFASHSNSIPKSYKCSKLWKAIFE